MQSDGKDFEFDFMSTVAEAFVLLVQFARRLDNADATVRLAVCVVLHLWCWVWHVGLHSQLGPECEHLQRVC